jgi:hypothetical protein
MAISFKVNGGPVSVDAPQNTPLLWVSRATTCSERPIQTPMLLGLEQRHGAGSV